LSEACGNWRSGLAPTLAVKTNFSLQHPHVAPQDVAFHSKLAVSFLVAPRRRTLKWLQMEMGRARPPRFMLEKIQGTSDAKAGGDGCKAP